MKKIDFNQNWTFGKCGQELTTIVALPYDAMIHEERKADCLNGKATGYFPGGAYQYEKQIYVPDEWENKTVILEFEGVYQKAEVLVNGKSLYSHPYGYTGFNVDISEALNYGVDNSITVFADNSGEPCTRWYCGSGIYRPVWLYVGEKKHIEVDGVQVTTVSDFPAIVRVKTIANGGEAHVAIYRDGKEIASSDGMDTQMTVPDAHLWSEDSPVLYECRVELTEKGKIVDSQAVSFGICKLRWSTEGLSVNGSFVKLRGACIHHDNGILGACEYPEAALRKVKILKQSGFNAIRCAHNPCSKALLTACDQIGIYVMDEFVDMWYEHKNRYDYADFFEEWHEKDLTSMIRKDVSHPSVILYSIGNEVTETAEPSGIRYTKKMTELIHELDSTRPVTCGINMSLNVMHFAGMGVYQPTDGENIRQPEPKNPKALAILAEMMEDGKNNTAVEKLKSSDSTKAGEAALGMQEEMGSKKDGKLVGSEYFNQMMVTMMDRQMVMVTQEIAKVLSEDAYAALDIAGYNYAITRYKLDAEDYPKRISVGTETLPQRIYDNWEAVMACPYSIGDFVWTGWDYLGEAGIGAVCYDSFGTKDKDYPFLLAGCGAIDILGYPRPEIWLNKAVYGISDTPYIGVEPVDHADENRIISAWRYSNAVHSWSWDGCEGKKSDIVIYSRAAKVKLFQDGQLLGEQIPDKCQAKFEALYRSGILEAVAYDKDGIEIGRDKLCTAKKTTRISLYPEKKNLAADGQDLCYLNIALTDEDGIVKMTEDRILNVRVTGAGHLEGFGSANPCTEEVYTDENHSTYYGQALAVIRAGWEAGKILVRVEDGDGLYAETMIEVFGVTD